MRLVVSILSAGLVAQAALAGSGQEFVGYRNDATGVYPADCSPVAEWNEWNYKTVERKDHRGKMQQVDVPDGEKHVNIVWKTPLQQWCNGGLVLAGGKLFGVCDRGGYGYATEHVPDFLGNLLVCMDPDTGKVLWKTDLHHIDKLPADKAKQVEADLRHVNEYYVNREAVLDRVEDELADDLAILD